MVIRVVIVAQWWDRDRYRYRPLKLSIKAFRSGSVQAPFLSPIHHLVSPLTPWRKALRPSGHLPVTFNAL